MSQEDQSLISQVKPWRSGAPWWLVFVEGVVALIIGIYIVIDPFQTSTILGLMISIFLVLNGAIQLFSSIRAKGAGSVVRIARWRGIIGIIVGVVILVMYFLNLQTRELGIILLWLGLILYGAFGVYLAIRGRSEETGMRWGVMLGSVIILLVGLVIFYGDVTDTNIVTAIGALMIILGILLILYGLARRMMMKSAEQATT